MTKRKFDPSDPFGGMGDSKASVSESYLETDSAIFGEIAAVDARVERIASLDIFEITPDPAQPRRTVPSVVRSAWDGTPQDIPQLFLVWYEAILEERGTDVFTLDAYLLEDEENAERPDKIGPIETSFIEVIDLAVSIRRDGLTNPITVAPRGAGYQLETGERRWLAFHLLHNYFDGRDPHGVDEREKWSKIPARQVDRINVWRQATENNARQDLNAIGKARQFAILMMDLWASEEKNARRFKPLDSFGNEQQYYAQAAELSPPHGKGDTILNAMGFKHRNAIQRYRDLLSLPYDIWQMADDYNCPEGILRQLIKLPHDEALAILQIWLRGSNVTSGDISVKKAISQPAAPPRPALLNDPACQTGNRLFSKPIEQEMTQKLKELASLKSGVGQSGESTKRIVRQMILDIRRLLDDIDHVVGGK